MEHDFRVESRSYDQMMRGWWQGYRLSQGLELSDEATTAITADCIRLWLPAGTLMHWSTRTRPLRYNCLQFFWPERWYMLSAFYEGRKLRHTYASMIQPATIEFTRLTYTDLDLSLLVKPDLTFEVLTQAEFEHAADTLNYPEDIRIGALMAQRTLISSINLGVGLFSIIPHTLRQTEFHLSECR